MSYAYFQGQEYQALDYYKKVLDAETEAKARVELEALLVKLEKAIQEREQEAERRQVKPVSLHNLSVA